MPENFLQPVCALLCASVHIVGGAIRIIGHAAIDTGSGRARGDVIVLHRLELGKIFQFDAVYLRAVVPFGGLVLYFRLSGFERKHDWCDSVAHDGGEEKLCQLKWIGGIKSYLEYKTKK